MHSRFADLYMEERMEAIGEIIMEQGFPTVLYFQVNNYNFYVLTVFGVLCARVAHSLCQRHNTCSKSRSTESMRGLRLLMAC